MKYKYQTFNSGKAEKCVCCYQYIHRKTKRHQTFNYNLIYGKIYCEKCINQLEETDPDWACGIISGESKSGK